MLSIAQKWHLTTIFNQRTVLDEHLMEPTMPSPASDIDVIVLGSGAAGLAAAVTAAHFGQKVLVIEKAELVGGTTAWSGGWIWAPCNPLAVRRGIDESATQVAQYLQAVLGSYYDPARVRAFLDASPAMVRFFEQFTSLQFDPDHGIPDTYSDQPHAGLGGRSVIAKPIDGRALGDAIHLLRPPLRETTLQGLMVQAGSDLRAFLTCLQDSHSLKYVMRRLARFAYERVRYGRSLDLRNGNALVARLLKSALDAGVDFRTNTTVRRLIRDNDRITGVELDDAQLLVNRGVVLACGGFSHDAVRRHALFRHSSKHHALAVPSATGDGLRLGEAVGAQIETEVAHPAAYCPVSIVPWPHQQPGVFPHIIDRGKPGVIAVLRNGQRFCNEGLGYHDVVEQLLARTAIDQSPEAWLICDHHFLRRYGLGIVRPRPLPYRHWVRRHYLKTAPSIGALADKIGVDRDALEQTVAAYNSHAAQGEDPEFGRGETAYMRLQGDPSVTPNPCVAPMVTPPFYALHIVPGYFGTFAGIKTTPEGQVLDVTGQPIGGLYAAGSDQASVFGGFYPAGGINLGPALTFGYLAGHALAQPHEVA